MAANESSQVRPRPSMVMLKNSSSFTGQRAEGLPTPREIRALNALPNGPNPAEAGGFTFSCSRPRPVPIPSLGLFVKYGREVTVAEAETQELVYRRLHGQVPTPEVFGWAEDGDEVFICMALVEGDSLQNRWSRLHEEERTAVCTQLKVMADAWRSLPQEDSQQYIGCLGRRPLNDIFIQDRPDLKGPFVGPDAFQQFHETCDIDISNDERVVFTHNDFCPPNIILTPGNNPRVAAIIDWAQSGWLPSYWESCKARRVSGPGEELSPEQRQEWWTKYLPMILDFVDDEVYHSFIYFQMAKM